MSVNETRADALRGQFRKLRSESKMRTILLGLGLATVGAFASWYTWFREEPKETQTTVVIKKEVEKKVKDEPKVGEIEKEKKEADDISTSVYGNESGRIGLEGDVRCYRVSRSGKEVEVEIKRSVNLKEDAVEYEPLELESDRLYRCKAANNNEWIGHNFPYKKRSYNVSMRVVAGKDKLYDVHGFNVDSDKGEVEFLVNSLDPGRYLLEVPVFSYKLNKKGEKKVIFLGVRELEFLVGSYGSDAGVDGKSSEDKSERPTLDTYFGAFGDNVLEAGR